MRGGRRRAAEPPGNRDLGFARHSPGDPEDWRERFVEAYDQEFREWIAAASEGTAGGPSTWDGYAATLVADAALRAVSSGGLEPVNMIPKPTL
ncbi:Gfo/Idh/MocA family oxidoreductase [Rhizobium sophoriradicis]|uniref:Gfo/Idh/MocA family oxidoreductase n=1 Tax=Rhizobium sophoriradicis TaxID=1535245 RepID=UPI00315AD6F6